MISAINDDTGQYCTKKISHLSPEVSDCIYSIEDRVMEMNTGGQANVTEARADSPLPQWQEEPGTDESSKL